MHQETDPSTGLPVGLKVETAVARMPERIRLEGSSIVLEPLDPDRHADSLWEGVRGEENEGLWVYLFNGPYRERAAFDEALIKMAGSRDPLFFALVEPAKGRCLGHAAYMRIEPAHRVIEVGSILYAPAVQRTRAATEAMYLMAKYVFEDLGYRRYEWKCNALNLPSRVAAVRLGFEFEGIFRQHMIVKGRNRDTAWFSMLDSEWPARKRRFEQWLAPENFDSQGKQLISLSSLEL